VPNRLIREGWLDSEAINRLSPDAERLFLRLCLTADDAGRFDGRINIIAARLFPLKVSLRASDVTEWLNECVREGLVLLYEFDGKPYIQVTKIQRGSPATRSKYPWRDGSFEIVYIPRDTRDGKKEFVSSSLQPIRKGSVRDSHPSNPPGRESTGSKYGVEVRGRSTGSKNLAPPAQPRPEPPPGSKPLTDKPWQKLIDHIHRGVEARKGVPPEWTILVLARLKAKVKRFEEEGVMALFDEACRRLWYPDRAAESDAWNARRWAQEGHSVLFFLNVLSEFLCEDGVGKDSAWKKGREKYRAQTTGSRYCGGCQAWTVVVTPDKKSLKCERCGTSRAIRPGDKVKEASDDVTRADGPGRDVGGGDGAANAGGDPGPGAAPEGDPDGSALARA